MDDTGRFDVNVALKHYLNDPASVQTPEADAALLECEADPDALSSALVNAVLNPIVDSVAESPEAVTRPATYDSLQFLLKCAPVSSVSVAVPVTASLSLSRPAHHQHSLTESRSELSCLSRSIAVSPDARPRQDPRPHRVWALGRSRPGACRPRRRRAGRRAAPQGPARGIRLPPAVGRCRCRDQGPGAVRRSASRQEPALARRARPRRRARMALAGTPPASCRRRSTSCAKCSS